MADTTQPMGDRQRDEDTGQYTDKYPPAEVTAAIEDLNGTAATSEVADALGADRDTIYKKLTLMQDRGQVTSRKAGGIRVWSISGDQGDAQN